MQLNFTSTKSDPAKGSAEVSEAIFAQDFNESLIHQVVTAYLAKGRQGTVAQKNRAAVRGAGKKPWRQKGTGRARAGTISSPIWRKGGVTFAAQPQDYAQKVNRKMYRSAMRSILSELVRQERLVVVNSFSIPSAKTKDLAVKLRELELEDVLIVLDSVDQSVYLAARNIPKIDVRDVVATDPVSLLNFSKVLITAPALKQFEERLA